MPNPHYSATHDHGTVLGEESRASREHEPPGNPTGPAARAIQGMVAEFHQVYGCATDVLLADAPDELIDLRIDLIQEELAEVLAAMRSGDALAVARELADLAYVTAGTAVAFGLTVRSYCDHAPNSLVGDCGAVCISLVLRAPDLADMLSQLLATVRQYGRLFNVDLDIAVTEVHRANLSKLGGDGRPIVRADGKILKPSGWTPPDMHRAVHGTVRARAIRDDFTVPIGSNPQPPPWWLDGIRGA